MLCQRIYLILLLSCGYFSKKITTFAAITRNIEQENVPLIISEAVQGSLGKLPCNITPPVPGDRVILVIWYKEGITKPKYSFDRRDLSTDQGSHWADDSLGKRAYFHVAAKPAALTIKNTTADDNGLYRCRVDFQKSPTRNSKVELRVIIPPENLVILDDTGNHIPHYELGPYNEGSSINITCVSTGGRPQPKVTWWHENTLLDESSVVLSDRRVSNVLQLPKLKRNNLNMLLTCQASNNNVTTPITSTVKLDMNLRPLIVKLQGENSPLSAQTSYELSCSVFGSRPPATITWWKGSTPMTNTREAHPDANMTTSILTFTPTIDDKGKFLSCRAEQTLIPESGMEDGWKLDIYHIPVVTLELGSNVNSSFREGVDVFFECNIKSNPWIKSVSWRHNGNLLENNAAEGIIVANQSLVLQNVSRARSGTYTCIGSNREGDGESNPVQLDIRFAPVCRPGQRTVYSSGRQETVKVACEVEANPSDVSFVWKFNTSLVESVDIPANLIAVDRARSVAHFTPHTENDYGTLLCWGTNEIGDQMEPCVYTIAPAGEPDPLTNCTLLNQTSNGFQIECIEGFDGGLQQDFIMEVYVNGTTRYPRICRSKTPYFEVKGLVPGVAYNVFLVAQNNKGRSNATILHEVYTLKDPEKQTDISLAYAPVIEDIRPFLGILVGIVGSIVLVALIIVIIVRMRGSSGRDRNNYSAHQVSRDTLQHNGQSIQDMRIGRDICQTSSVDSIDKNPDIIPQDGRDEEDEWISKVHNRAFTTAALAEQNAVITSSAYDRIPYAVIEKQNHIQHQHPPHPQYITTYSTLIPVSKMGLQQQQQQQQQQKTDLTYAELAASGGPVGGQRMQQYSSATLGRPRQSDIKRAEPNIYSQIDLAHHHPMYSTSSMYGTNTITGVTMSHPSQLATFPPPPPIFASNSHHHPNKSNSSKITVTSTGGVVTSSSLSGPPCSMGGGQGGAAVTGNGRPEGGSIGSVVGISDVNSCSMVGGSLVNGNTICIPASSATICTAIPVMGNGGGGNGNLGLIGLTGGGAVCFSETTTATNILKTVPEEICQMNMEDIPSKSNHTTRF